MCGIKSEAMKTINFFGRCALYRAAVLAVVSFLAAASFATTAAISFAHLQDSQVVDPNPSVLEAISQWEQAESRLQTVEFAMEQVARPARVDLRGKKVVYAQAGSLVRVISEVEFVHPLKQKWVRKRTDYLNDGQLEFASEFGDVSIAGGLDRESLGVNDHMVFRAPRFDQYDALYFLGRRFRGPDPYRWYSLREVAEAALRGERSDEQELLGRRGVLLEFLGVGGESISAGDLSERSLKVLLDSDRGMQPTAIVETIKGSDGSFFRNEMEVREWDASSLLPVLVVWRSGDGKEGLPVKEWKEFEWKLSGLRMNHSIDPTAFEHRFPGNSVVFRAPQLYRLAGGRKEYETYEVLDGSGKVVRVFRSPEEWKEFLSQLPGSAPRGSSSEDLRLPGEADDDKEPGSSGS